MHSSDLIIIGSGPGGYQTALYAVRKGMKVTIIEKDHVGGTCLNHGCIPTKTLCRNAEVVQLLSKGDVFGLKDLSFSLDFNQVMARKQQVVDTLRKGVETLLSVPGIQLVRGTARFSAPKVVRVDNEEYTAPYIIIATGSKSKSLPIPGADGDMVVDSSQLLDITTLPKRLCIVGAGVIGMEFASIFSSFGTEVTVVEYLRECLPTLDSDIAKRLRQTIARRGVTFIMQAAVTEINSDGVVYERKGKKETAKADMVLMATGRTPNTDSLDLDKAGINTGKMGIVTDEDFLTSAEGVYAIGDVNGRVMLAHAATAQGRYVIDKIMGQESSVHLGLIPAAIFTLPEAACVGVSEDVCKDKNIPYQCLKGYYRANGKALAMDETEGMVKVITDEEQHIIGCHIFGTHSADIVQEVTALMSMGATLAQLSSIIHIHPTVNEILELTS